jgi:hypothetical protein
MFPYARLFSPFFRHEMCAPCSEILCSLNVRSAVFNFYEFIADINYITLVNVLLVVFSVSTPDIVKNSQFHSYCLKIDKDG